MTPDHDTLDALHRQDTAAGAGETLAWIDQVRRNHSETLGYALLTPGQRADLETALAAAPEDPDAAYRLGVPRAQNRAIAGNPHKFMRDHGLARPDRLIPRSCAAADLLQLERRRRAMVEDAWPRSRGGGAVGARLGRQHRPPVR